MKQATSNIHLILITSTFPFGVGEAFLESELPILAEKFDNITIVPVHPSSDNSRSIPSNVDVNTISSIDPTNLFGNLLQLADKKFWQELLFIKKQYKLPLTLLAVKQLLSSLYVSKQLSKAINPIIQTMGAPTIMYSYWADESALALALLKKNHPALRTVTRTHGWDVYFERRNTGFIPYRSLLFKNIDMVSFIAEQGRAYTVQRIPSFQHKFRISYLGTLEGQSLPDPPPMEPFRVVSVSNLIDLKRVDLIIQALSQLNHPVQWVHFGDGPNRAKLETQATQLLKDKTNVNWEFRGRVTNKEVLAYYRQEQPHLFVNVSTTEGLPVSIMEAMAHSVPVVATDVGGTREIVQPSKNGFLLPADLSANLLSEQIIHFIAMETDDMRNMREAAYDTWFSKFNAHINYKHFAEQLLQL